MRIFAILRPKLLQGVESISEEGGKESRHIKGSESIFRKTRLLSL